MAATQDKPDACSYYIIIPAPKFSQNFLLQSLKPPFYHSSIMSTKEIFPIFHEFPACEDEFVENCVPQDTFYEYVPSCFIAGLVNHINVFKVFAIERYNIGEDWDEEEYNKVCEELRTGFHGHFGCSIYDDDVIFLGETANSFWLIWYDCDVSDCKVGRTSKNLTRDEFVASVFEFLRDGPTMDDITTTHEFPVPRGWISF
jgi:hypothetical protein